MNKKETQTLDKILEEQKEANFTELVGTKTKGNSDRKTIRDLQLGEFASREQTEFYDSAYGDLLFDYFKAWLGTEVRDKDGREFIYNSALALGDLRNKLSNYSTLKNNIEFVNKEQDEK